MMRSQQSRRPVTHLYSNWHDNETIISFNVCKRNHFSLYLVGMLSSRGLLFLGSERNLEDQRTKPQIYSRLMGWRTRSASSVGTL